MTTQDIDATRPVVANRTERILFTVGGVLITLAVIIVVIALSLWTEVIASAKLSAVMGGVGGVLLGFSLIRREFSKARYILMASCLIGLIGQLAIGS